jgi:hypothetical protein
MNSVYDKYPDDDNTKEIYLQAARLTYAGVGDRHVLLWWLNGVDVIQIIQLTGQPGNYGYYAPVAQQYSVESAVAANLQIFLGEFTRAQREQIMELARKVKFERKSVVNSCRTWTRDLLEAMVEEGLISQAMFEDVDEKVPLLHRKPEV